jgi:hypothetical protein
MTESDVRHPKESHGAHLVSCEGSSSFSSRSTATRST